MLALLRLCSKADGWMVVIIRMETLVVRLSEHNSSGNVDSLSRVLRAEEARLCSHNIEETIRIEKKAIRDLTTWRGN